MGLLPKNIKQWPRGPKKTKTKLRTKRTQLRTQLINFHISPLVVLATAANSTGLWHDLIGGLRLQAVSEVLNPKSAVDTGVASYLHESAASPQSY